MTGTSRTHESPAHDDDPAQDSDAQGEAASPAVTARDLHTDLIYLRAAVCVQGARLSERWVTRIPRPEFLPCAENLAHYIALRRYDLRPAQRALASLGMSSLGRIEGRVMPNLDAVTHALAALAKLEPDEAFTQEAFYAGQERLEQEDRRVFGPPPLQRRSRIMVTLGTDAANPDVVRDLLRAGMNAARINPARGDLATWETVAHNVQHLAAELGTPCALLVDLPGKKLRLGSVTWFEAIDKRLRVGDRIDIGRVHPSAQPAAKAYAVLNREVLPEGIGIGTKIWLDDGRLGAVIDSLTTRGFTAIVTHARRKGEKLTPGHGVNLPGIDLGPTLLTEQDRSVLEFALREADILGLSYMESSAEVSLIQDTIRELRPERTTIPLIIKVETPKAVTNLPEMLVTSAGQQPTGVMIARGDLALESGYRRLVELQEEILWLCEAASIPTVWATQVLDKLARTGAPTRAELSDAAMGERAECVMLNKGDRIVTAVELLDDVLTRMHAHQNKKSARLRPLAAWRHLL